MKIAISIWFLLILIAAIWIVSGCTPAPTNVYTTNNQPPQQQCQTLTITGIGQCVPNMNCPYPSYWCETVWNSSIITTTCNPNLGMTRQVCK